MESGGIDFMENRPYPEPMSGVQFVVDDKGEKTAVVIDLKQHSALWEDFYDVLTARDRAHEPRESLQAVRRRLIQARKLRG